MAKKSVVYKCSKCGYTQPAWLGRCPECGEWNSLEECILDSNAPKSSLKSDGTVLKAKPVPMQKSFAAKQFADFNRQRGI